MTSITFRTTLEKAAQIDAAAKRNGLTRAAFVRKCCAAGFSALKDKGEIR
jgi:uncharacterized protein (DUF1778 family)